MVLDSNAARDLGISLSIVMPYYNEELNVERSLNEALAYLRPRFEDFEVVAVDDCSRDGTLELARKIAAGEPRVKIIALPCNSKFAGALKAGFAAASKEYVFYTDGDCPIDFTDIDRALAELTQYDAVVGYRITRDKEGWLRKLYTTNYRMVLRLLFGLQFKDINFSFKLIPKKALEGLAIESTGSFIDAELLFKLRQNGWRIGQIPVHYHSRRCGESTLASPAIILKIWREMWSFWWHNRRA